MSKIISSLLFIRMLFSSASSTKSNLSSKFLFYVLVTIVFFVGWAILSDFDQVISSEAKIIPFNKLQTVQHFEGGIINMIHVRAGQKVNVGSQLLSLSPIEANSGYQSKKYDYMQALARIQRLEAEYKNTPPVFSQALMDFSPSLIQNEKLLIQEEEKNENDIIKTFSKQITLKELINYCNKLYEKGYSGLDILKLLENHKFLEKKISFEKRYEVILAFNKVKNEFRNEKIIILFILNFLFLSLDVSLENISFM